MSEIGTLTTDLSEDEFFQSIDNWRMDPVIDQKFKTLKEYNGLLQTTPLTVAELKEWVAAFNNDFKELVDSSCSFTGLAQFPVVSEGEVTLPTGDYDAEPMYFRGVVPVVIDRPPESAEDKVLYQLNLLLTRQDITPEGKLVTVDGFSETDQVVRLEFDSAMSIERAIQILQVEAPELLTEIDCAIYNPDPDVDPAQRLLALKGLSHHLNGDEDDDGLSIIRRALGSYTNEILAPDEALPYTIKIYGHAWSFDETGSSIPSVVSAHAVATLRGVIWTQHPVDEAAMIPQLLIELHTSDPSEVPKSLCVPVTSVEQLDSMRHGFYATS